MIPKSLSKAKGSPLKCSLEKGFCFFQKLKDFRESIVCSIETKTEPIFGTITFLEFPKVEAAPG